MNGSLSIDGVPNERAWDAAPIIDGFRQLDPQDGAPASERTEVRILFDDHHLYIAGWMYDRGPLVTRLGRRDIRWTDTDQFVVFLDTYHDHRTAFRFTVNPSGVIRDEIVSGGGSGGGGSAGGVGGGGLIGTGAGDATWDPVWDARSSITPEGWFFEMRIPFGQMGFNPGEDRCSARGVTPSRWPPRAARARFSAKRARSR
jgi:hypothetical protein